MNTKHKVGKKGNGEKEEKGSRNDGEAAKKLPRLREPIGGGQSVKHINPKWPFQRVYKKKGL